MTVSEARKGIYFDLLQVLKSKPLIALGWLYMLKGGLISASVVSHRAEVNIQSEQKWDKKLHGAL